MLLPGLNRAKLSANLIYCQANLRQIGQAIQIYGSENGGSCPWGKVSTTPDGQPLPTGVGAWQWTDTLSIQLKTPPSAGNPNAVDHAAKVFNDLDIADASVPAWEPTGTYGNYYMANFRYMPETGAKDTLNGQYFRPHKIAVKDASRVAVVWDGSQILSSWGDGSCYPLSYPLDQWQTTWGHCYVYPDPVQPWMLHPYDQPVQLGDASMGDNSMAGLQRSNVDSASAPWNLTMRFRHMQNTTGNFLFADGHVEGRKLGEVKVRDICMNP